jgi:hypothetical protein
MTIQNNDNIPDNSDPLGNLDPTKQLVPSYYGAIIALTEDVVFIGENEGQYCHQPQFLKQSLPSEFDINYPINLLKVILDKCRTIKVGSGDDLRMTLQESCRKLLAFLETQRDQGIK